MTAEQPQGGAQKLEPDLGKKVRSDLAQEHPEQALDLAVRGQLTPGERAVLDRHLAVCAACVAHLELAGSLKSVRAADSVGAHDDGLDRWAVEHAMSRLAHQPRWWRVSPRWGWAFAGVVLLLATAVSAKLWSARQVAPVGTADDRRPAATAHRPERRARASSVLDVNPTPEALAPEDTTDTVDTAAKTSATTATAQPRPPRRALQPTAAELFQRAHELGHEGKFDAALAVHLKLQRTYPNTAEASLSSALAGRLLLDRNRPREAMAQFDRYLARGGPADEEALAGRAASLQQLGRHAEEATAWRALLRRHPGSVYADRAHVRLRDLSAR